MMQELNYIRCGDYYIPDIRLIERFYEKLFNAISDAISIEKRIIS